MTSAERNNPILLDRAVLAELESRWQSQGAPIVSALRPGLSDDEMDRLTEPLGLSLPREAREWWGWHNGAPRPAPYSHTAWEIGPSQEFC